MKQVRLVFALLLVLLFSFLNADQNSFFSMVNPTGLGNLESEISIQHRFRGAVDDEPFDNFFGMDNGANVALSYRQSILYGLEAKLGYIRDNSEYNFDAAWHFTKKDFPVQAQINLQYYSFQDFLDPDKRRSSAVVILAAQNLPVYNRFYLNANLGYDFGYDAESKGLGLGIGTGIKILPALTVLAEYYPDLINDKAVDDLQNSFRKKDSYSLGVKLDTYGHHFMFMLGNNEDMNLRQIMHGSLNNDLKFGFNIQRRFGFFN